MNPATFIRRSFLIRSLPFAAFNFRRNMSTPRVLPDCWGHRGASSRFPENTLASFEAAMRDGSEGIESDVHVSKDDVVIMFHDPDLSRTTNSTGHIKERTWFGEDGMQHARTIKQPHQAIPTFAETIELLMRPENLHVKFNVDVKPQNDPDRLFSLMHKIVSSYPNWEHILAPRLLLGLWHPRFLPAAKEQLPYCRRSYLGTSTATARKYFWNDCEVFSIGFASLTSADGERFRKECKEAGKNVVVWTVNEPTHMMEAVRWGVHAIITDTTTTWLDLRRALQADYDKIGSQYSRFFLWTTLAYYTPFVLVKTLQDQSYLERVAGPFDSPSDRVKSQ